ncbi:MAG: carbon-nitrogen hydrolase family protein [Archaeoglobaceae archaeon]|nr:carbon-nitrogen hydrolase family protein [Archaeoglobaceae archaeon]
MIASAIQCRIGDLKSAERVSLEAIEKGAEILLYPEYFSYSKFSLEIGEKTINFLRRISKEFGIVACGNFVCKEDLISNRATIFDSGDYIAYQDKIHPTKTERFFGITAGKKLKVFRVRNVEICILICADILYPELCRVAALKGAEIVLNPVVSFKYSELPGTELRHCLYFARSFDNCYAIVKAGGFGTTFAGSEAVGRSLIASFEGLLAKSKFEEVEEAVVADIDLNKIREYRKTNYSLKERNIEAYLELFKS